MQDQLPAFPATDLSRTVRLGDLVVAAFDEAATHSTDPREVSRRATQTVMGLLRRARPRRFLRGRRKTARRVAREALS